MAKKVIGAKKPKNFLNMEMLPFEARKEVQWHAKTEYDEGNHLLLCGIAGTGKTHLAIAFAMEELEKGTKENIHIFRSAVATRDLGFLPGTLEEKMAAFDGPYVDIVNSILDRADGYEILRKKGTVTFNSTSYLRGLTFKNCVIIVDECQNLTRHEIDTMMTRMGKNCRYVLCGDSKQSDIEKYQSGFGYLYWVLNRLNQKASVIEFEVNDIVRDDFVRDWIIASDEYDKEHSSK